MPKGAGDCFNCEQKDKKIEELEKKLSQHRNNINLALGLVNGSLHIKDMEEFDKAGLIRNLEEVKELLTK